MESSPIVLVSLLILVILIIISTQNLLYKYNFTPDKEKMAVFFNSANVASCIIIIGFLALIISIF